MLHVPMYSPAKIRWRRRSQLIVITRFQYRYAALLAFTGLISVSIIGGITSYFLNSNYNLLMKAQIFLNAKVVDNLSLELRIANSVLLSASLGFVIFLGLMGLRFSQRLVFPVFLVQEKMKDLCRGKLSGARVHIRRTDEFQELGEAYNYLVESLRIQTQLDIDRLSKIKPDDHNRDAIHIWEGLLEEKKAQLSGSDSAVTPATTAESLRAS